jgi:hypothetical protein
MHDKRKHYVPESLTQLVRTIIFYMQELSSIPGLSTYSPYEWIFKPLIYLTKKKHYFCKKRKEKKKESTNNYSYRI